MAGIIEGIIAGLVASLPYAAVGAALSALSYLVQTVLAPNPRKPTISSRIDNLRTIARDNTAPLRVVYGTYLASGVLLFARSVNREGKPEAGGLFLHGVLAMAHGPIESISDIQLNDEPADSTRFANLAAFVPFNGAVDQPMFTGPVLLGRQASGGVPFQLTLPEEWLEKYRPLRQVAYLWFAFRHDPSVFPAGAPTVRALIRGRLVYDPRKDSTVAGGSGAQRADLPATWTWSNNWALCVRDFLVSREYGMGIPNADIDDAATITAADVADELIDAPSDRSNPEDPLPQTKRYTIDGLFETNESPIDILAKLLQAGNGALLFYGGQYRIKAGAPEAVATDVTTAADITLTPDDLRDDEDIQITRLPGRKDRVNTVRGSFINPAKNYIPDQFVPVTDASLIAEDGNIELPLQLQLDFTQHPDRARYIAAVALKRARLMQFTWPTRPGRAQLVPLSVVKVTHPHFGWTNKLCRITDLQRLPTGAINLVLEEYADSTWDEAVDPSTFPDPTDLPSPFELDPPTNVAAVESTHVNPDGTRVAKAIVTWEEPARGFVEGYLVSWRPSNLSTTTQTQVVRAPATRCEIIGLEVGTYVVQVRSTLNVKLSAPETVIVQITYATTPPPDPIDLRVRIAQDGTRALRWEITGGTEPPDLLGYEVRWAPGAKDNTTAEWDAAIRLRTVGTRSLETRAPTEAAAAGVIRGAGTEQNVITYFVRAIDRDLHYSNGLAMAQVTLFPSAPDIAYEAEFGELGWPGTVGNATRQADGSLAARSTATWADFATWADMATWGSGGGTMTFTTEILDLGRDRTVRFAWDVHTEHADSYIVQASFRRENDAAPGPYIITAGGFGRYVQLRLTVYAATSAPVLHRFGLTLREYADEDIVDDVRMGGSTGVLYRLERDLADWGGGVWQVNVQPRRNALAAPNGDMACDPERALLLNGTNTYATAPDYLRHRLLFDAWTIEGTVKFDATAGACVLMAKAAADWAVDYTGTHIRLLLGGSAVSGALLPIPDKGPIYHWAWAYGAGELVGYLNGRRVVSRLITLAPPTSTGLLAFGGTVSGGSLLKGLIEECRIWTRQRSDQEVIAAAGHLVDPREEDLAGYWRANDGAGSTLRDATVAATHATISGTAAWRRMAYRESPPIPLTLLPKFRGAVAYYIDGEAGGSTTVEVSVDDGATWQAVGTAVTPITGVTVGSSPTGTLRMRQYLQGNNSTNAPSIRACVVALVYDRAVGELVVQPRRQYAQLRSADIAAVQDATRPGAWTLIAKDAIGARFRVADALTGEAMDTLVDVRFRGTALRF